MDHSAKVLHAKDAEYPEVNPFKIWFYRNRTTGLSTGSALLFGVVRPLARVFFYAYRGYTLSSGSGGQHMVVELQNVKFSTELSESLERRLKATERVFKVRDSNAMEALAWGGVTPPPPPPARAQPAAGALGTHHATAASSAQEVPAAPAAAPPAAAQPAPAPPSRIPGPPDPAETPRATSGMGAQ